MIEYLKRTENAFEHCMENYIEKTFFKNVLECPLSLELLL